MTSGTTQHASPFSILFAVGNRIRERDSIHGGSFYVFSRAQYCGIDLGSGDNECRLPIRDS
jgi:hypothetical protein